MDKKEKVNKKKNNKGQALLFIKKIN